jgi:uncharacterized membrane protein
MNLRNAQAATLLAATITTGLMAGVFALYAHAIMPGLRKTDDRTFVAAFQEIDKAVVKPWFMPFFIGALVFTGLAGALHRREEGRSVLVWVVAAFVLYLAVVVITAAVNVPLNDDIKAAGDPDRIADLAAVRNAFHETRWVAWNIVRAIATTVAFGCLTWALVLHGRATDTDESARPPAIARHVPGSFPGGPHADETVT